MELSDAVLTALAVGPDRPGSRIHSGRFAQVIDHEFMYVDGDSAFVMQAGVDYSLIRIGRTIQMVRTSQLSQSDE